MTSRTLKNGSKTPEFLRSPLRYPGGKSRVAAAIISNFPEFSEYREPFLGGGSVFLSARSVFQAKKYWINDKFPALADFWKHLQTAPEELIAEIKDIKQNFTVGRELYQLLTEPNNAKNVALSNAAKFFVLNRITFSGTTASGGFSEQAFNGRFTESSIERLKPIAPMLQDVKISNLDYSDLLKTPGENVFIYLDPPYFSAAQAKLYGKKGSLHKDFSHARLAEDLKNCPHKWLMTIDNVPEINDLYSFAKISKFEISYGMRSFVKGAKLKGTELLISNN